MPGSAGRKPGTAAMNSKQVSAASLRALGNSALESGRLTDALSLYSQCLDLQPDDAACWSNRSHAHLLANQPTSAYRDALQCVQLAPEWPKAYYRLAAAALHVADGDSAAAALHTGLRYAPDSKEMQGLLRACVEQQVSAQLGSRCQRQLLAVDLADRLLHRHQMEQRLALEHQLSNSMAAVGDWEPADWEWRPTWCAETRYPPQSRQTADAAFEQKHNSHSDASEYAARMTDPITALLAGYCIASSQMKVPEQLLSIIKDTGYVGAYAQAISAVLAEHAGSHVMCLGPGAPVWGLLAAVAGAGKVTIVPACSMSYKATHALLEANQHVLNCQAIEVSPVPLHQIGLAPQDPSPARHASTTQLDDSYEHTTASDQGSTRDATLTSHWVVALPADVVITDQLDASVLGAGLIKDLIKAAELGLITASTRILPSQVEVMAQLSEEAWVGCVSGVDMSRVNEARWYPGIRPVRINSVPVKHLTETFLLAAFQLDACCKPGMDQGAAGQHSSTEANCMSVMCNQAGVCNTVHLWPRLGFTVRPGVTLVYDTRTGTMSSTQAAEETSVAVDHDELPGSTAMPQSCLWQPSLVQGSHYLDACRVTPGKEVALAVLVEQSALHVRLLPAVPSTPRSLLLPLWHVTNLLDSNRTAAYETAIRLAVLKQQEQLASGQDGVRVLHLGAGCGLLPVLVASKLPATTVMCQERSPMSAMLYQVLGCNPSVASRVTLTALPSPRPAPPGSSCELQAKVLVLENIDAGLLGEGVLRSISSSAASGMLCKDTTIVPCAAKVWFQLICWRPSDAQLAAGKQPRTGLDARLSLPFKLATDALEACCDTSDYLALNLSPVHPAEPAPGWVNSTDGVWKPLSAPQLAFEFDFHRVLHEPAKPENKLVTTTALADGVVNAVLFWHELQMNPANGAHPAAWLGGSPMEARLSNEQVAVQRLGSDLAVPVQAGQSLEVQVCHDTHAINFTIKSPDPAQQHSGPAAAVLKQAWLSCYGQVKGVSQQLDKACSQDPQSARIAAATALAWAARPQESLGLDGYGIDASTVTRMAAQLCQ